MPSLKDVKNQISGIAKTKQITKAMGMVASSKLRGSQARIERFRPYATKFAAMLGDLAARCEEVEHPLLEVHEKLTNVVIVLITSDRGLCGGFNANLITKAFRLAKEKTTEGKHVRFICVGKKARDAVYKSPYELWHSFPDALNDFNFQLAVKIGNIVSHAYESYETDEVLVVFSEFGGMARQVPTCMPLLPVVPNPEIVAEGAASTGKLEYEYEPAEEILLANLLPRYVNVLLYRTLLDTSASEHAARMTAMDNATRNCDDLLESLTLLYNKTRQAAITSDLMDIVGGANALQSQ